MTKKINVSKLYDDFANLGWDYTCNRMSRSAMECYDAIAVNLGVLEDGEHWNEDAYTDKGCDHLWHTATFAVTLTTHMRGTKVPLTFNLISITTGTHP